VSRPSLALPSLALQVTEAQTELKGSLTGSGD
jgi:hypothetical protein